MRIGPTNRCCSPALRRQPGELRQRLRRPGRLGAQHRLRRAGRAIPARARWSATAPRRALVQELIRGVQVPAQVWSSAYPDLPAVTIDPDARLPARPERWAPERGAGAPWLPNPLRRGRRPFDHSRRQGGGFQGYGERMPRPSSCSRSPTIGWPRAWLRQRACRWMAWARAGEPTPRVNLRRFTSSGLADSTFTVPPASSGFSLELPRGDASARRRTAARRRGCPLPPRTRRLARRTRPGVRACSYLAFASDAKALAPILDVTETGLSKADFVEVRDPRDRGHQIA